MKVHVYSMQPFLQEQVTCSSTTCKRQQSSKEQQGGMLYWWKGASMATPHASVHLFIQYARWDAAVFLHEKHSLRKRTTYNNHVQQYQLVVALLQWLQL